VRFGFVSCLGRCGITPRPAPTSHEAKQESMGKHQRTILEAIRKQLLLRLRGAGRIETIALRQAARALEKRGLCLIVRLWNEQHTQVCSYAARPGAMTRDGQPV